MTIQRFPSYGSGAAVVVRRLPPRDCCLRPPNLFLGEASVDASDVISDFAVLDPDFSDA